MKCKICEYELNKTFNFCPVCGSSLNKIKLCKKCNILVDFKSNFCPTCGNDLSEKNNKIINKKLEQSSIEIEPIPEKGIVIEFPYSSSQSYEFAVNFAKEQSGFKFYGEGKKILNRVHFNENEILKAVELAVLLKSWRNKFAYINGKKTQWDNVFHFVSCFEKKQTSYRPESYCFGCDDEWQFNLWGCVQAVMSFGKFENWLTWGCFQKDGTFTFDKNRIRHELEKKLFKVKYCPYLDLNRVEKILKGFPDTINPNKDKDWDFMTNFDSSGGGIEVITEEYGYKEKVIATGVYPKSKKVAMDILLKIVNNSKLDIPKLK